jgi:hypothetical protein
MVSQAKGAFISGGSSGYVEHLKDDSVLKPPHPGEEASCEMEGKIYELLGRHNRLVPMLGYSSAGLNLEYMENESVRNYLRKHTDVPMEQKLQWA